MIKSRSFWIAAFLIALLPWLAIDLSEHRLDWKKDVREELINVVQGVYSFSREEKASILDRVFEQNKTLIGLMYLKGFLMAIMAAASVYFFKQYKQRFHPAAAKPLIITLVLFACIFTARILLPNQMVDSGVKILSLNTAVSSLQQLHTGQFQGKVVYVDFWGTTCGPCLQEFRNFTNPLKEHYRKRKDIGFLYIAQGNEYLWRKQIQTYRVKGEHLFLAEDQYAKLYRDASGDTTVEITMPRYVILDKGGAIVEPDAKRPSEMASLLKQLDNYLVEN